MKRRDIEAKIARLENDLAGVIAGGSGIFPLIEYAKGEGTGYRAYAKAKETIEALIVKAKAELASLPKESAFEKAKQDFIGNGDWNTETEAYIAALDACRPWVIVDREDPSNYWRDRFGIRMFQSPDEAGDYMKECLVSTDLWLTVQWEGVK